MRKRLNLCCAVLAAVILSVALFACGKKTPVKTAAENKTEAAASEKPAAPEPKPQASARPKPPTAVQDSEEGSLKVKFTTQEQKENASGEEAEASDVMALDADDPGAKGKDAALSRKEEEARKALRTKRPDNSLAEQLSHLNEGKVIRWSPKWISSGTGGVRLPARAQSQDGSVIVFVETLGEGDGPFSSRLVIYDTHTWTILAVHHLMRLDVRSAAFTKNGYLGVLCRGQAALKTQDELQVIRLRDGASVARAAVPEGERVYCDSRDRFYVVRRENPPNASRVKVLENLLPDLLVKPMEKEMESANGVPLVAFSDDGERIYFAGGKALESFKGSDLRPASSVNLPADFEASSILAVGPEAVVLAPRPETRGSAIRIQNGQVQPFGEPSGGLLASPIPPGGLFYAMMSRKGKVALIALSTLQEKESFFPESVSPRTTGNPEALFTFPHVKCVAVLDAAGSFYLVYKDPSGKRFRKEILFSARKD